ncbi:NAD-dependent epimerase/dehydratase family protein [Nonomuraea gerenzanensis]|uniref:UDP-glucose 4-epimerase n=1 Tax=Nonomuraea gerenzanensis TaxID=93944 RepID=A0A1M4EA22_9ACTN|nr:NAD-dependent epimerase/dehydratase family protein [Nonomuraea gerenzanensis]UBU17975.1 NAD-dependent epimerase/dehydratase family protein [Nonomuraea gerenzanensis]SBO95777.1 UDP-glucose 4-epimerase [Nonomuraea gerenzanensis]
MTAGHYLVTGATGFIGGRLTRMILARGGTVTALARPSPRARALRELGVQVVTGDLATGRGVEEALRGADRVIHLAATLRARTPAGFWAVNRDGVARLLRALAAQRRPGRLVLCSSLAAGPAISLYGASKRAGEQVAREYAGRVPAVILRPGIVYGPGEQALLPALLPMIRLGVVVKAGCGPRRYGMIYVDDLCTALLAAAERGPVLPRIPEAPPVTHPAPVTATRFGAARRDAARSTPADTCPDLGPGLYPISDGKAYEWADICHALARAAGCRAPVMLPVPMPAVHALAALTEVSTRGAVPALNRDKAREMAHHDWTCVPDDAVRELGFTPATTLTQGFEAALAALRTAP